MHAVLRCSLLLQMSHVAWCVCMCVFVCWLFVFYVLAWIILFLSCLLVLYWVLFLQYQAKRLAGIRRTYLKCAFFLGGGEMT